MVSVLNLIIYCYISNFVLLKYAENSEFGQRVLNQLKAQENANAAILSMLTSLQQAVHTRDNVKEVATTRTNTSEKRRATDVPLHLREDEKVCSGNESHNDDWGQQQLDDEKIKRDKKRTRKDKYRNQNSVCDKDSLQQYLELEERSKGLHFGQRVPAWYASNVEAILIEQHQRQREFIDNARSDASLLNSILKIKSMNR